MSATEIIERLMYNRKNNKAIYFYFSVVQQPNLGHATSLRFLDQARARAR
jgi:predicted 3-demethylubiquinone-9 3-methyltransferase (glyoxalase superfamily)